MSRRGTKRAVRPRRNPDRPHLFAGSYGDGIQVPSSAPAPASPETPTPHLGSRPSFTHTPQNPFEAAGVHQCAAAYAALNEFLTPDGHLPVTPPMWEVTPEMQVAHWGLRQGRVNEYEQVLSTQAAHYAADAVDDVARTLDRDFPGAGPVAKEYLADRVTPTCGADFDITPAGGGEHALRPHPFNTPCDPETHLPCDADPVMMRDLHRLLTKPHRVVETVDDLAAVVHLSGDASPDTWQYGPELPQRILQAHLSEDATYQALAFVYSNGRSTDTGMSARWRRGTEQAVDPAVRAWLLNHGYGDDPWDEFATWAVADNSHHVDQEHRAGEG